MTTEVLYKYGQKHGGDIKMIEVLETSTEPHSLMERNEAQGGEIICLRSYSKEWQT